MIILFTPKEGIMYAPISLSFNPNFMPVVINFVISLNVYRYLVRIWNNLPHDLVSATSVQVFKKCLKKFDLQTVCCHIY